MATFDHDYTLPAIPIPELEDTCQNLKKLIKPLVGKEAWEEASNSLAALAEGQGTRLQESLLRTAGSDAANASWLRPIWDDMYLSYREMLPVNLNYAFQFVKGSWGTDELPALMAALARTIGKMRTESLPPEPAGEGYLSMDTVANMIYTRIPGKIRDSWYYPPLSCPLTASVVCQGHWFILSLTDSRRNCLPPATIAKALTEIREQAEAMEPAPFVGALTCFTRELAAELRGLLQTSPGNRLNLELLEKSAFTVCLDEPLGEKENFNLRLVTGAPQNRWFNKSLQIISDGRNLGVNIEHSACDASIWAYLLSQANESLQTDPPQSTGGAHILPLTWHIPETTVNKLAATAEQYLSVVKKLTFGDRRIISVSKNRIKALKYSPDAFVQMLYQVAYYKLTGRFGSIYEAVSTRNFYQGRTDCVRSVTEESVAFVRSFCAGEDKASLVQKFQTAVQAHTASTKRAQKALGSERHMLGLSMMAQIQGLPLPDVFATEGYKALRYDTLSTSSITAPFIDFFSFGPVVKDGLGIGYGIKPDSLHVVVSVYQDSAIDPAKFIDEMEQAAEMFYRFL